MENSPNQGRSDGLFAIDRGLYVGPILAIAGLLTGQPDLSGGAAVYWIFSYAYCAPWLARLVRHRVPAQDHELVAAILGWAATPWGLFIAFGDSLTQDPTIHAAVLGAMAPGVLAAIAANFTWRRRASAARSVFLVSGAIVYLGWIAAYVWLAARAFSDLPVFGFGQAGALVASLFMAPAPFIALWVASRLLAAPFQRAP